FALPGLAHAPPAPGSRATTSPASSHPHGCASSSIGRSASTSLDAPPTPSPPAAPAGRTTPHILSTPRNTPETAASPSPTQPPQHRGSPSPPVHAACSLSHPECIHWSSSGERPVRWSTLQASFALDLVSVAIVPFEAGAL